MTSSERKLRRDAKIVFRAALQAADAASAVRKHLRLSRGRLIAADVSLALDGFDRIFLIAAGKAAVDMGYAVEEIFGPHLTGGVVVTKHGHVRRALRACEVRECGHPVPDEASVAASRAIHEVLRELNARDLVLLAISGGASALLSSPAEPITLREKQKTTGLLLRAGASITELNIVRKHLSSLKGGYLAALAYPATLVCLLLSDVVGDRIDVIGSGLASPDPSTFADAIDVLMRFGLLSRVPTQVRERLEKGAAGLIPETPKPGDQVFENTHLIVIASNRLALKAAAQAARELGYRSLILSSSIEGEAREVARVQAAILREAITSGTPVALPACILSGGETTVAVRGNGRGGRAQEFALSAAIAIAELRNALILSAGTDGTDGPTDAAGAVATGTTLARARKANLDAAAYLARNDSYSFFESLGDLLKTGPTGTNVMDVYLLLAC